MDEKVCPKCNISKTLDQFRPPRPPHSVSYSTDCRKCLSVYAKGWRERNPTYKKGWQQSDSSRNLKLQRQYGITLEMYREMVEAQGGGCAVCGKTAAQNGRELAVDHDHACCPANSSCGKCIRGILCAHCNALAGHAQDSIDRLQRLIGYLSAYQECGLPKRG